jgi:glycosyltransferase involved in cell wall biosynthesis
VERKKILFLVAHRLGRSPGQRFRFEQYLDYLSENGFDYQISNLIDEQDDKIFYSKGKYFSKARILWKSLMRRRRDLKLAANFDIVFMYRDAHMLGTTFFEKRLKKKPCKLVLDFDDSIWLNDVSQGNQNLAFLKRTSKVKKIIKLCDLVITGNKYLAEYAKKFNSNVAVVPTTLDTEYYTPQKKEANTKVCIGWTGSSTTLKHLALSAPMLEKLKNKYGDKLCFRIISDVPFNSELLNLENIKWNKETEVADLRAVDIGIMPLPNDDWAKGKCGFKGLQYMALAIPAVMSPVGVNTEIVSDGQNGFLAEIESEWIQKISLLIESPELREKLGNAGRETVVNRYSYNSQKEYYVKLFHELTN